MAGTITSCAQGRTLAGGGATLVQSKGWTALTWIRMRRLGERTTICVFQRRPSGSCCGATNRRKTCIVYGGKSRVTTAGESITFVCVSSDGFVIGLNVGFRVGSLCEY